MSIDPPSVGAGDRGDFLPGGLFSAADLTELLGEEVSTDSAAIAERMAWGWLAPILGIAAWPVAQTPVPAELFAWALELGAIAWANPTGTTGQSDGPFAVQFSLARRQEILDEVRASDLAAARFRPAAPVGRFEDPEPYPDPALPGPGRRIGGVWVR